MTDKADVHQGEMPPDQTSEAAEAAPRAGRPPALSPEARRGALVDAAERVFSRDGFAAATMEGIAAEAGMSKRTLYRFFPDKKAALEALLDRHDQRALLPPYGYSPGDDPEEEIRRTLLSLVRYMLDSRHVALLRVVIAEAPQIPALTDSFEAIEVSQTIARATARFERLHRDGAIGAAEPWTLASLMLGALIGPMQLRALARVPTPTLDEAELSARLDLVMQAFRPLLHLPAPR